MDAEGLDASPVLAAGPVLAEPEDVTEFIDVAPASTPST